jgi:subtilisin family serine protease
MALPDRVFAQASPRSIGGKSLLDEHRGRIAPFSVGAFASAPGVVTTAARQLLQAGFEILQVSPFTINIAGPPDLFMRAFRTQIEEREVTLANGNVSTHLDSPTTETLGLVSTRGTTFEAALEGVALEVPRAFFQAAPIPPAVVYWHLTLPDELAAALNATILHRFGIKGKGVKVAMVDSGWFRHPYFTAQGYDVAPVVLGPGATVPDADESGHGTGESANVLAVAPECRLMPVKMNFVNTLGAFNQAVALKPDVITCSWGSDVPASLSAADLALEASVAAAVASGIAVVFSAGNGHAGFPGQHPDVISAGGTYMDELGNLEASTYSSGFQSAIYPGRRVPDVCGLVGQRPRAIYLMLPVEPGDEIDTGNSANGLPWPDGDETPPDDGWAAFSGTSAAAPQIAGVVALMKQLVPGISPLGVKSSLGATARDVESGFCSSVSGIHNGLPALPGPDDATGAGLVDAFAAVAWAFVTRGVPVTAAAADSAAAAAYWQGYVNATMFNQMRS